jgi:hypothetical protein
VANAGRGIHLDGPLRAATSFPQVILTAASFNPHLWYRIGQVRHSSGFLDKYHFLCCAKRRHFHTGISRLQTSTSREAWL